MATIKELEAELAKAKKLVVRLSQPNFKLEAMLRQVETALAQANSQVEELRSAVDDLTSQKVSAEENLKEALTRMKQADSSERQTIEANRLLNGDLRYENQRRVAAENKAYELEKKVLMLSSNHEDLNGIRANMVGLRINRHGDIA